MDTSWPTDPNKYVTAAQVARRLDYVTVKAFYAARPKLDQKGFPAQALPRRWRAYQVEQWEAWNAANASARVTFTPANDAPAAPLPAPAPIITHSPARAAIAKIQRQLQQRA